METKYNTSFIPKKFLGNDVAGSSSGTPYVQRRSVMGPFHYLTVLLFIAALLGCGGVFAYVKLTQRNIDALVEDLQKRSQAVDKSELESFIRLNLRLEAAADALNTHSAADSILTFIEGKTLQTVRYVTFEYSRKDAATPPTVTLSGTAPDFKQVALQARQFEQGDTVHNVAVTELEYGTDNAGGSAQTANFSITATVDPRSVSYANRYKISADGNTQQKQTAPATSQTTVAP